jgi:hypothetical protein
MPGACSKAVQHDSFDQIFLDTKNSEEKRGGSHAAPFFLFAARRHKTACAQSLCISPQWEKVTAVYDDEM